MTAHDETTTQVYSPVSGRVDAVAVHVGDHVAKDAVLMTVDATDMAQGRSDLAAALSAAVAADAQLRQARTTEQRQRDLYQADGGALKDWQQAQVDLVAAETAARTAQAALAAVRDRLRVLGRTPREIAALGRDTASLAPTVVRAPIAGTVTQRQVSPGQYVNGAANGGAVVFTLADLSTVWLLANVREADAPAVAVGQEVEVRVPAYPARVFRGRVTAVAPAIDPTTRRLAVRVTLDNADGALKPEMMATVRLAIAPPAPVLAVPERAVIHEGDVSRVWVADAAHHALALRLVTLGRQQDGLVEVLDGLKPGDTVVTKGALFIDRAAQGD
ncbi:efflux RND transporter periplasmic adaptor subunit [Azospirillum sp. B4]|uniref:efflux RND transporter periplasmic adaptor subunit n=1 Tax=Azospirillum sp. B4 TaxID=95605 RepID=UPI00131F0101|nr:efflux RND transporter periplasmic adaptor subunit [Azospirillum sp. B4]